MSLPADHRYCDKEPQIIAAVRGRRVTPAIARHIQACPACSEILLVGTFLRRLKPRERQILWLAYVDGACHKEIAQAMGLRAGSVRPLLLRARHKLAGLIGTSYRTVDREMLK
jgi:DNA-directed RNA polymerase specialized sigma24 family protein